MRPSLPPSLERLPVVGILRGCPLRHVEAVAGAAIGAGVTVLEVTLDSERPFDQISALSAAYPGASIGAGSVRTADDVRRAVAAGARFVVSPIVDPDAILAAQEQGVASIPGAATPTEIELAVRHRATAVKVFPVRELGGPAYIRAILAPLGSPPLVPTGGVDAASAARYLRAGAIAVGLGGSLFPAAALESGDTATVARLARDLVERLS